MTRVLYIMVILASLTARASGLEHCTDIDIRDMNPALREHFSTPRNQGSVGWCYAFAAADLLSVEVGGAVSAFHVAAIYNRSNFNNFVFNFFREHFRDEEREIYESGWLPMAVNKTVNNRSVCLEDDVPFNENNRESNKLLAALDRVGKKAQGGALSHRQTVDLLKNLSLDRSISPEKLARSLRSDNINVTIEKLVAAQCQGGAVRVPELKTELVNIWSHGKDRFYQRLNEALEEGRPVALRYNPRIYTGKKGVGSHVSVIIGRRWKGGKCQYKIRNSWGQRCNYRSGIECNKSEGSFWMDANDMARERFGLYLLSGRKKYELPIGL